MTQDLHHLAAAYALDALDPSERRDFEQHYPGCDICAAEVDEFRSIAASLAVAEAAKPPASLRERTLAEVSRTPQLGPLVAGPAHDGDELQARRNRSLPTRLALGAAAAALVLVGVFGLVLRDTDTPTSDLLAAPDAVVSTLTSVDGPGILQVVWSDERDQVAVIGNDLAPANEGKAYALWFVVDDEVVPAMLFKPSSDRTISTVADVADLDPQGWGITIEPSAGSRQPTTPILFSGSV